MHAHSSRCILHIRMGKRDNSDCACGFKHGPPNQPKQIWDEDLKLLSLQRNYIELICHHVAILLFLKININFVIMGDKSARQPNNLEEEHLFVGQMVKLCCITLQSMIPKLIFMLENN